MNRKAKEKKREECNCDISKLKLLSHDVHGNGIWYCETHHTIKKIFQKTLDIKNKND